MTRVIRHLATVCLSICIVNGGPADGRATEVERLRKSPDRLAFARALHDLGEAELSSGAYAEAAGHGEECVAIPLPASAAEQRIACLTVTGRADVYQGKYVEAAKVFERALEMARASSLPQSEVTVLNDLGSARYYVGDYGSAHDRFEAARVLAERYSREPWAGRRRQIILANLAMLDQRLGQYERALDIYRDLAAASSLKPAERARLLSNLGALYRRLGDPYKAIEQYQAAEALFATTKDQDGEIGVATNRGIALAMDLRDLPNALAVFRRSLALAVGSGNRREQAEALLYSGETLRRMARYSEAALSAGQALAISKQIAAAEEQWKALLIMGRIAEESNDAHGALTYYDEAISIIEKLRTTISGVSLRSAFLGDKIEAYDGAIRTALRSPAPAVPELFHHMEQIRARTLRDRISGTSTPRVLSDVQRKLPPDVTLLEYWTSGNDVAALWITRKSTQLVRTGAVGAPEIDRFVSGIRDGGEWQAAAKSLGASLLRTVPLAVSMTQRLIIIPDRALQAVPFETLFLPGSSRTLIDDYEVSYLPSASILTGVTPDRGWLPPWRRMLLGFADPGPRGSEPQTLFGNDLASLPAAREEIQTVATEMDGRAELHSGDGEMKHLLAAGAAGVPVLHFATHGIADPEDPDRSRLVLPAAAPGASTEYLFAREIYDLNLSQVRLATLAACDTEKGTSIAGEGPAALSRAFLSAGVRTTVSTLWRIGDNASLEFMKVFYDGLSRGDRAAASLRNAKLRFKNSGSAMSHPKYWAAFVLNGEPGTQTPRPLLTPLKFVSTSVLVGAVLAIGWTIRRRSVRKARLQRV